MKSIFSLKSIACSSRNLQSAKAVGFVFLYLFAFSQPFLAQKDSTHKNSGFIDPNVYYDSRDFSTFTVNTLVNLPAHFQYFSTMNFFGHQPTITELSSHYMENHLWWTPCKKYPLDLAQYWVSISGPNNDALKYGFRWRLNNTKILQKFFDKIHTMYAVNFYLIDLSNFNNVGGFNQLQHVYRISLLNKNGKKRLYIGGFANQYHSLNGSQLRVSWVTEHQLGIRMWDGFHAVAEYRINQFYPQKQGIALGFEYLMQF